MEKQKLLDRIKVLTTERDSALSTYNGAIQDCMYWVAEIEKQETNNDGQGNASSTS